MLLSYKCDPPQYQKKANLHWHSVSAIPWGPCPFLSKAKQLALETKPDWVIGFSDTWYGIMACHIARSVGAHTLIDAYDNYESYIPWAKPLHWAWRQALKRADAVTAAGPQLAELMSVSAGGRPVRIVPMAADPNFFPMEKATCRTRLGLPRDRILIGYTGSLYPSRDIELLFSVFEALRSSEPRIELVLSGRVASRTSVPAGTHWLGYRPPEEVPLILNSLDLLIVVNKPGDFGDYSYPVKIYEAMACNVPVVATDVAGTSWVLRDHPRLLVRTAEVEDFVATATDILSLSPVSYPKTGGWVSSLNILEGILRNGL
ncbi:glycosyltransferase [Methylococcus sp. EFPC2]|uniref:glycosyltransferase n=1 Tax=Methylococcus sp. EFPC2 TaxID=2812648 RepID=UPI001F081354|nr:glycosyltransferase [Methylococcus sp. EFPC2]